MFKTKQAGCVINGNHTDIVLNEFQNKLMVIVTQLQKMGTVVLITNSAVMPVGIDKTEFNVQVLMGKDEPVTHVFARNLASSLHSSDQPKPIVLSLALVDHSPAVMRALQTILVDLKNS